MFNTVSRWLAVVAMVLLAGSVAPGAQTPTQTGFAGLIDDFAPGGWVVHGVWSLQVQGTSGKADFSAALDMVRSDYWVIANGVDPDDPSLRAPHTHHVVLEDGNVVALSNGFRVTGTASVTGNGNAAPFGLYSPIQIDIVGGANVPASNIKVTFGGGAAGHFGTQPLDGVVSGAK